MTANKSITERIFPGHRFRTAGDSDLHPVAGVDHAKTDA